MNFGDQAKSILATVAPLIGTALGGPLGGAAGAFIAKALGVPPDDSKGAEALITAGNPDTLLKLKQAELDFQEHMKALDVQEDQLAYADTDSARKREVAVKDSTPTILAFLLTAGFFGLVFSLLRFDIPAENKSVLFALVGILGAAWKDSIGYYFGSSSSSRAKDMMLWQSSPSSKP